MLLYIQALVCCWCGNQRQKQGEIVTDRHDKDNKKVNENRLLWAFPIIGGLASPACLSVGERPQQTIFYYAAQMLAGIRQSDKAGKWLTESQFLEYTAPPMTWGDVKCIIAIMTSAGILQTEEEEVSNKIVKFYKVERG